MNLLWVKSDFLHPTNRGGQIRTLEMLRAIHRRHNVHYVAFDNPAFPEGLQRAGEYCSHAWPIPHRLPERGSAGFAMQAVAALVSPLPLPVSRYCSGAMTETIRGLLREHRFDSVVCDFIFPVKNIPDLSKAVLFQHNVESTIWERHVEHAGNPLTKAYFSLQSSRMRRLEAESCRKAGHVVAVSQIDCERMKNDFGAPRVSAIETGVDLEYFARPSDAEIVADLVFIGSMDWMPNIDGIVWFVREVLPLIRRQIPNCSLNIVGRKPGAEIAALARGQSGICVTGTVPDVRPWLWQSKVAIVPLRIGGGTRLKIYEAQAAGLPVVSTVTGAEGLPLTPGEHIAIADSPEAFANECTRLLLEEDARRRLADSALKYIAERYSWGSVARAFEAILEAGPRP